MSEKFNPHQDWLGIAPEQQPPNHYRLLGIGLFEADPAAINAAAEARLAQVRGRQTGATAAIANHLKEQINAARKILLAHDAKLGYDRALKNKPISTTPTPAPSPPSSAARPMSWRAMAPVVAACAAGVFVIGAVLSSAARREAPPQPEPSVATAPGGGNRAARDDVESSQVKRSSTIAAAAGEAPGAPETGKVKDLSQEGAVPAPKGDSETASRLASNTVRDETKLSDGEESGNANPQDGAEEPRSVTLADGTALELETYGDRYQGYEAQAPITADEAETVVDCRTLGWAGFQLRSIRLDVKGGKMYWIDTHSSFRVGHIRCAGLNGESPTTVVGPNLKDPRGLDLDLDHRMLYWSNAQVKPRKTLTSASMSGGEPEVRIDGIGSPAAVVVDAGEGVMYYFDLTRLICARLDGSDERLVVDAPGKAGIGWSSVIDRVRKQIYWAGGTDRIARVNLDGSALEVVVALGNARGQIWGIAFDAANGKLYWIETAYGTVSRTNRDGSQLENLVVGVRSAGGIDLDLEHGCVYWTANLSEAGDGYGVVQRAKLPPVRTAKAIGAPPLIQTIEPAKAVGGAELTIRGSHFTGVERVEFVGDGGERLEATHNVVSDRELRVVVPIAPMGVKRSTIVVLGPGGVTVALTRECRNLKGRNPLDRFRDARTSPMILAPGSSAGDLENAMAVALATSHLVAGERGGNVLFMKNGSSVLPRAGSTNVIYHEPFARLGGRQQKSSPLTVLVGVPAIRLSFIESLFEYER